MDPHEPTTDDPQSKTESVSEQPPNPSHLPFENYFLKNGDPASKKHPPDDADGDHGFSREKLSRWPVIFLASGLTFLFLLILYGYIAPKPTFARKNTEEIHRKPEPAKPNDIMAKAPDTFTTSRLASGTPSETPLVQSNTPNEAGMATVPEIASSPPPVDYERQAEIQMRLQREQLAAQHEAERREQLRIAMAAPTTVYSIWDEQHKTPTTQNAQNILPAANEAPETTPPLQARVQSMAGSDYLPHTRQPALSPYEVKAGTVIPSIMISGINSDLPGQLIAQVSQNIYDSATGRYLLIPQGSRLVGTYDHAVNIGQQRVLIVWNRIIYPDASSLNLEAMSGQDQSGYAGFKDRANHHVWPAFRNALLLSAVTAGVQLSQPRAQKGDYAYSSQQMIAGSLGMQLNQLGLSNYQNRTSVAPTLTIRPGYRFNVMVSKDIVLQPWQSDTPASSPMQAAWQEEP